MPSTGTFPIDRPRSRESGARMPCARNGLAGKAERARRRAAAPSPLPTTRTGSAFASGRRGPDQSRAPSRGPPSMATKRRSWMTGTERGTAVSRPTTNDAGR